jgi:DNA primase
VLFAVRDPVERSVYIQRIARHLGVSEDAIIERARQGAPGRARPAPPRPTAPANPEDTLLTILLRYPHLRQDFRNYPSSVFTNAINREVFERWLTDEEFHRIGGEDPVIVHASALEGRRLPPLSHEEARTAAADKMRDILRERVIQHQAALTEEVAEAEKALGARAVDLLSHEAWQGGMPSEDGRALAETMIEHLQLGLSIHRREQPGHA